ncbi:MAG: chemotaxis protein CheW [Anaeromyxobacteraceae bacterium]
MTGPSRPNVLLVRAGSRLCALPLACVVETLRPLHTSPLAGTPACVSGVAVVRGAPTPVVDLDALLGSPGGAPPARFVILRLGERRAALAVTEVVGLGELSEGDVAGAPLLDGAADGAVAALRSRDDALLVVLAAARLVPEAAWRAVDERAAP